MKKVLKWIGILIGVFILSSVVFYLAASPEQKAKWVMEQHIKDSLAQKPESKMEASVVKNRSWHDGGTLINAKSEEWNKANDDDKIATCGELLARIMLADKKIFNSDLEWRNAAIALANKIDNVYKVDSWKNVTVKQAAAGAILSSH